MRIDWFTFVSQLVNFGILIWILKRFLYQPILKTMSERQEAIRKTITEAEEEKNRASKEREQLESERREMTQNRENELKLAHGDAQSERGQLILQARDEFDKARIHWQESLVRELDDSDTLYLGDGANDSLAFDAAWITGTPVVDRSLLETKSDFFFLGQSLRFLPLMLDLARRRRRAVAAAFAFALLYNASAVTAAVLGHMTPLAAAVIMPLSSAITLAIVAAGLRDRSSIGAV